MAELTTSTQLLSPLHASAAMRSILSDRARVQRMLDFEAALASALASVGVITTLGATEIAKACNAERFDLEKLAEAAIPAGNIAIPVIEMLTEHVATRSIAAAGCVHWGATSQDVIDTALALELRAAIDALLVDLDRAINGFTGLAGRHRRTLGAARTMLVQALPVPFGYKLAAYAGALARSRDRLWRLRNEALVLQLGGAAGTLAALGDFGLTVAERVSEMLDLPLPDAPWHSHRDRLAEVAAGLGILAGTCGKIARDVALMMQTEVGEAYEPEMPGRGGSSTLPQKRNPVAAAAALSAAAMAPNLVATLFASQVQEHERSVGGLQTEWVTYPALALITSGALGAIAEIAEGLEVDVDRVRANLDAGGGQIMAEAVSFALAPKVGKSKAHKLIQSLSQRAAREGRTLKDVVMADDRVKAHLTRGEIGQLFLPSTYQGSAQVFIDRLIASTRGEEYVRPEGYETPPSQQFEPEPEGPEAETAEGPAPEFNPEDFAEAQASAEDVPPAVAERPAEGTIENEIGGALMEFLSKADVEDARRRRPTRRKR